MDELLLDVKSIIASYDAYVFYQMWRYDHAFRTVAPMLAKQNISLFRTQRDGEKRHETFLFDKHHSFDDEPSHETKWGDKNWHYLGEFHREDDRPAVSSIHGNRWFVHGKLHRDGDLPAIMLSHIHQWYKNGILHRKGGLPAVIYNIPYTHEEYWYRGMRHRDGDLPAVINGGRREWWKYGKRDRLTGYAIEDNINRVYEYWINDCKYTETRYRNLIAKQKIDY
jgi:hypothetical protein